jgi:hypothetical protein
MLTAVRDAGLEPDTEQATNTAPFDTAPEVADWKVAEGGDRQTETVLPFTPSQQGEGKGDK